jgi:hypothetical protein
MVLAASLSGGFLTPNAAVVSKAESVIQGGAAAEFAKYQADLQKAEASSRLTASAFADLKSDASQLEAYIDTAPLTSQGQDQDLVLLQDVMDQAFIDGSNSSSAWSTVSDEMGEALNGVTFTTNLPNQAYTDMQTVAQQAHVSAAMRAKLQKDEQAIVSALGPNVDTALGGSVARDPVLVYFDGQVTQFVHRRAAR